jgi:hypothetical protein
MNIINPGTENIHAPVQAGAGVIFLGQELSLNQKVAQLDY